MRKAVLSAIAVGMLLLWGGCITLDSGIAVNGSGEGLGLVDEAWDMLQRDYVDKSALSDAGLARGAVRGMVEALDDPYTSYIEPEDYDAALGAFESSYEGIGATVAMKDGYITVVAPITGSPAEAAGLRSGDRILAIDGESTEGMNLAEAVMRIRGAEGTAVMLEVLHEEDAEAVEIEIIRGEISLDSVGYEMHGDIAYLYITHFTESTNVEMSEALKGIESEDAAGIVLDLRGNPGGYLTVVVDVASGFMTDGVVVTVLDNQGGRMTSTVTPQDVTTDLDVVVLVDSASASGSEVLAGAFQDRGRAVIAGEQTFGKGSVNILRRLSDGSGLYITTARWLTPDGTLIEGEGITPDYELDLETDDAVAWAIEYLKGRR